MFSGKMFSFVIHLFWQISPKITTNAVYSSNFYREDIILKRSATPARGRSTKTDRRRRSCRAETGDSFEFPRRSGAFGAAETIVALAVHVGAGWVHPGRLDHMYIKDRSLYFDILSWAPVLALVFPSIDPLGASLVGHSSVGEREHTGGTWWWWWWWWWWRW